jgi:hypothetical protein
VNLGPGQFGMRYKAAPAAEWKEFVFFHAKTDWAEIGERARKHLFPDTAPAPSAPVARSVLATPAAAPAPIPQQASLL